MLAVVLIGTLATALSIADPAQAPDGKAVFDAHCRKCHGTTGRPTPAMKKLLPELPVWDAAFFDKRSEEDVVAVLLNGKGKNMKPFKELLKPEEMAAVARYIRTLKPSAAAGPTNKRGACVGSAPFVRQCALIARQQA